MYPVDLIARYIIWYEGSNDRPVSNLRLQKLLYFVQINFLAALGEPCFTDRMEAWDFGPVIPSVYRTYKRFGSMAIQQNDFDYADEIEPWDQSIINDMLDVCAAKSTSELVRLSHSQEPWQNARSNPFQNEITVDSIRNYVNNISIGDH